MLPDLPPVFIELLSILVYCVVLYFAATVGTLIFS